MINEIKQIVDGYLNNRKLACLMVGTVVSGGVKVSEKLTLPWELVDGTLRDYVATGDTVRLIRDDGGARYYIVEIIGYVPAAKGRKLQIEPLTIGGTTISEIKIKDVVK
ncbi:DNA helicase [Caproiciproducens galactitolivorans]|uniref:Uncharacterized protein n=1 Tax=Caproiciproducens galactitolivorans TaxID=642589 RepID=A0A4Z0Y6F2_9FIRM|nr:DNA helicase [Caproiciproducens galactitolivorans]TGJ75478.1 hypothetical protein CAGA_23570 [Caproiciproducens galactitolivorans]